MFFELKSESSDNSIRESEDVTKEFAVKAITTLSSMTMILKQTGIKTY